MTTWRHDNSVTSWQNDAMTAWRNDMVSWRHVSQMYLINMLSCYRFVTLSCCLPIAILLYCLSNFTPKFCSQILLQTFYNLSRTKSFRIISRGWLLTCILKFVYNMSGNWKYGISKFATECRELGCREIGCRENTNRPWEEGVPPVHPKFLRVRNTDIWNGSSYSSSWGYMWDTQM